VYRYDDPYGCCSKRVRAGGAKRRIGNQEGSVAFHGRRLFRTAA
jgi:hypothetical protein